MSYHGNSSWIRRELSVTIYSTFHLIYITHYWMQSFQSYFSLRMFFYWTKRRAFLLSSHETKKSSKVYRCSLSITFKQSPHRVAFGVGLCLPWVWLSQMLLARWLPMAVRTWVSSRGQSSKSRERTLDRCVPRLRWIPEHSMQINAPRLRLAHVGSG